VGRDGGFGGYIGTCADITERKRFEEEREGLLASERAARQQAESTNRIKDEFLNTLSHELRTPLNAILGWADMLCRRTLDGPVRERAARTIRDSAKRQAQLIDDLLDVARISSGKLRLDKTIVDIRDVVIESVQVLQPAAELKGIHLTVEMADGIDTVYGDASRLQQIAWNLLSNAVKFTPNDGTVRVRLRQVRSTIELSVTDTGEGIPTDFLPAVFEPFRQADASSTRVHPGLGLGLSIVKSLVEAHSGTIEAQSEGEGRGATFVVRLPAVVSVPSALGAFTSTAAATATAEQSLDGISVLVVDDDRSSLDVVAAHLQHCGARVITAGSAPDAREIVEKERVDVLLADIGMPGEDGYSLIRRIRTAGNGAKARIPAAALTALARREDRQQALQAGFQLHLTKPVDPRSLVAAVTTLHRLKA
jgi:CheY-like chemotaxis protein